MMPPPPCSAVSSRWGGLRSRFADDVECFFEVAVEIEAGVDVGGGDGVSVVVSVVVAVAAGASWGEDDVCAAAVGMDVMLFEHTSKAGGICLRESRKQMQVGKKRGKGKEGRERGRRERGTRERGRRGRGRKRRKHKREEGRKHARNGVQKGQSEERKGEPCSWKRKGGGKEK